MHKDSVRCCGMKQETTQLTSLGAALCLFLLLLVPIPPTLAQAANWFSGVWNSNIYNLSEKPRTVGVRIELIDGETGLPVSGARAQLKGFWLEERVGTAGDEVGIPYQPQEHEFEMTAVSARDGVVVFALSWQKEYPWHFGRPEPRVDKRGNVVYYDAHTSWKRAVDDVEKVQWLEIGHPGFIIARIPFDLEHLTEFGQDKRNESQEPRLFEEFEEAWHREMREPGVKFCVLDIGTAFSDFGNKQSSRAEFFERIRAKDFGTVYLEPINWFSMGDHPQSVSGPFSVYLLRVELERRPGQIDINIRPSREEPRREREWRHRSRVYDDSERTTRKQDAGPIEERKRESETHPSKSEESRRVVDPELAREKEREAERAARESRYEAAAQQHPLGIVGETLSSSRRREMGLFIGVKGVVVNYVLPFSPADKAGLRAGMVIESVYHRTVSSTSNLDRMLEGKCTGEEILIGLWNKKGSSWERDSFFISLQ